MYEGKIVEEPFGGKEKAMEEKQLTNWQTVGIGTLVGFGFSFLAAVVFVGSDKFVDLESLTPLTILGFIGCAPFSIAAALIGKKWKKSRRATWIGAILGTILGLGTLFSVPFWDFEYGFLPAIIPGIPSGIIGALIGKDWRKSRLATFLWAVIGILLGIILVGWSYAWASLGFAVA
jgi:hypothetical protein